MRGAQQMLEVLADGWAAARAAHGGDIGPGLFGKAPGEAARRPDALALRARPSGKASKAQAGSGSGRAASGRAEAVCSSIDHLPHAFLLPTPRAPLQAVADADVDEGPDHREGE
jgi:hypothetical protein